MPELKTWIGLGIISIIGILASAGYLITDKTFYCESKGIVMECARFSSSGLRCYPSLTANTGYKDCNNWTKLQTEDINKILNESVSENKEQIGTLNQGQGISYLCPPRSENKPCEVIR